MPGQVSATWLFHACLLDQLHRRLGILAAQHFELLPFRLVVSDKEVLQLLDHLAVEVARVLNVGVDVRLGSDSQDAIVANHLVAFALLALDHTDDIGHEQAFDIFIKDLRARDEIFEMPSDPLHDTKFIQLLTRVYDPGKPHNIPTDPVEDSRAA